MLIISICFVILMLYAIFITWKNYKLEKENSSICNLIDDYKVSLGYEKGDIVLLNLNNNDYVFQLDAHYQATKKSKRKG